MSEMRAVFDLVRVVDPVQTTVQAIAEPIGEGSPEDDFNCFSVWNHRRERCLNCISLLALQNDERQTKYEFIDHDIFYVIAIPVEVDGRKLALEAVNKVNDHVLLSAYGTNEFVSRITAFNAQLHLDGATGLFNRQYYFEKLFLLCNKAALNKTDVAVTMAEIDGFEHVASHFGSGVAEEAILAVGRLLAAHVSHRRGDFIARYDSNAFMIVMDNIPRLMLRDRLVELVRRITTLRLIGYEDVHLNVSMGVFLLSENRSVSVRDISRVVTGRVDVARASGFNRIAFTDR